MFEAGECTTRIRRRMEVLEGSPGRVWSGVARQMAWNCTDPLGVRQSMIFLLVLAAGNP